MKTNREFKINSEYSALVDFVDENEMNNIIQLFRDATVNQTWAYNHLRSKKCSTLILKRNGAIAAAAILRLTTLPGLRIGVAYLGSGPLWRLKSEADNINSLHNILFVLRKEYVIDRELYMRISPNLYTNIPDYNEMVHVFSVNGFHSPRCEDRTLFLDLEQSESDIRKGFYLNWRRNLNRAEKTGFSIHIGTDDYLFKTFKEIYKEMVTLKNYQCAIDINETERIQSSLPEELKYTVIICDLENRPMSGGVFSTIGDTGVYFLGATNSSGRENFSSFIVHWEMIKWMKKQGLRQYDLGGCSPEKVPETYYFKAGILGKNPPVYQRIGIMDLCENPLSKIAFNTGIHIQKHSSLLKKIIKK